MYWSGCDHRKDHSLRLSVGRGCDRRKDHGLRPSVSRGCDRRKDHHGIEDTKLLYIHDVVRVMIKLLVVI